MQMEAWEHNARVLMRAVVMPMLLDDLGHKHFVVASEGSLMNCCAQELRLYD
jgi:hypothetical protein